MGRLRIGTAGWSIPRNVADSFPAGGSALERYAARFDAAEINSSFHRLHRPSTYARWAESVPADFRFSVKVPKEITHKRKLVDCAEPLATFLHEIAGLGEKRGPLLVQLPPSLAFDAALAAGFFALVPGAVCEPRHPSWFEQEAKALLAKLEIARVAADPALVPAAAQPGGWDGLRYYRLHGSPRMYWSSYDENMLTHWAAGIDGATETWVMFDNTAGGAAAGDALRMQALL